MDARELQRKLGVPTEIVIVLVIIIAQVLIPSAILDLFGTLVIAVLSFWIGRTIGKASK